MRISAASRWTAGGGLGATASRYALGGLANTALGFGVVSALDLGFETPPALANAAGFAVGFLLSLGLNAKFVFRRAGPLRDVAAPYAVAVVVSFAVNQAVLAGLGGLLGAALPGRLASQAGGIAAYSALLFALSRWWVFRGSPGRVTAA